MRFFYNETLGWDENKLFIPPRKQSSPLAEVFSPEEIVRLIRAARGLKQRVLLMTAYSAGLRVSELVSLKINDIDPARMTLRIRQGKGGKDRYAILSENLLAELRVYWKRYRPAVWLFPNRAKNGPSSRNEAWHIFNSAKRRAGLKKGRGIHSLRAMFCHSSVLEAGVDLRSIQLLMGHTSLMSTQRYLRLSPQSVNRAISPLDRLPLRRSKPWAPALDSRQQEAALNWPIFFAPIANRIAATIRCRSPILKLCRPWSVVALQLSEPTSSSVMPVALSVPPRTPAAIDTALNANRWLRSNGSINKSQNCCRLDIFIWCLPCRTN